MIKKKKQDILPSPDFLTFPKDKTLEVKEDGKRKHRDAFLSFCEWAAKPAELRQPSTQRAFERKWKLPTNYTSKWKRQEDFQHKRLEYVWRWMFDKFPDVIYGIYRRAKQNSTADAKLFVDLIGARLEKDAPKKPTMPLMIVGVNQEKIDKLFSPKNYDQAAKNVIDMRKEYQKKSKWDKQNKLK